MINKALCAPDRAYKKVLIFDADVKPDFVCNRKPPNNQKAYDSVTGFYFSHEFYKPHAGQIKNPTLTIVEDNGKTQTASTGCVSCGIYYHQGEKIKNYTPEQISAPKFLLENGADFEISFCLSGDEIGKNKKTDELFHKHIDKYMDTGDIFCRFHIDDKEFRVFSSLSHFFNDIGSITKNKRSKNKDLKHKLSNQDGRLEELFQEFLKKRGKFCHIKVEYYTFR